MCIVIGSTCGRLKFSGVVPVRGQRQAPNVDTLLRALPPRSILRLKCFVSFSAPQLFVIVVWNFELYMIPLALLLPLAWNYILITSGKDTRQDVVRSSIVWFKYTQLTHNIYSNLGCAFLLFFTNTSSSACYDFCNLIRAGVQTAGVMILDVQNLATL